MEFVTAKPLPRAAEAVAIGQTSNPISQMQLSFREAGFEVQQPGHFMGVAICVDNEFAERHVAPTLAMDGTRRREIPQTVQERPRAGQARGM
jgi:hypothetical protein